MRLRTKRRRGERDEDGTRFLRRPAASFDPSLIIVVSIELIATLALARRLFDRSRFFNPLLISRLLFLFRSPFYAGGCSDDFSLRRANCRSVTWDHVSRFIEVGILAGNAFFFEDPSIIPILCLARTCGTLCKSKHSRNFSRVNKYIFVVANYVSSLQSFSCVVSNNFSECSVPCFNTRLRFREGIEISGSMPM